MKGLDGLGKVEYFEALDDWGLLKAFHYFSVNVRKSPQRQVRNDLKRLKDPKMKVSDLFFSVEKIEVELIKVYQGIHVVY